MKHSLSMFACAVAAAAAAAGCVGYESKTTTPNSPTATTADVLVGTWKSASTSIIPDPNTCTDFTWTPTQQSATAALGAFSATCAGGLKVSGTAGGTLNGSTITWSANGIATTPEIASCPISLNGTAELGTGSIRIPYSGTTCLGPVSGVEILNKK
jgi:hypothetical protein